MRTFAFNIVPFFVREKMMMMLPIRRPGIVGTVSSFSTSLFSKKKGNDDYIHHGSNNEYTNIYSSAQKGANVPRLKSISPEYRPRGENQDSYFSYLNDDNIQVVLGVGPAGSGKTLFACYTAVQELKKGNIQKIIMTRPLISVDKEDIGFLPGSLVQKMDPWTRPIFDILLEFFSQRDIDVMIESGVIEISPLAYMRGRTFKRAFIIADEMQNSSPNQMLMMLTRIGEGSKIVITGDLKQSDRMDENGLLDFIQKLKRTQQNNFTSSDLSNIRLVEFKTKDIERSPIVSKILNIYDNSASFFRANLHPIAPGASPVANFHNISSPPILLLPDDSDDHTCDNDCALIPKKDLIRSLRDQHP